MPVYEFIAEFGEVVEVFMSFADHDRRVKNDTIRLDDGRTAKKVWSGGASQSHRSVATTPGNYPMVSANAGVHPAQIKEHQAHLKSMGCGHVEHTKDGDVVFQDKGQRKRVCEALGLFDRRAGFSDPQPKHRTKNCKSFLR